ncbi:MAG: helix-turn-helix domain-containing protein [Methylocystaceae bacterium]|nr:helix-turn-helix domain-containing protein [Methylocystaceae bacterium]
MIFTSFAIENGAGTIQLFIAVTKALGLHIQNKPDNTSIGEWLAAVRQQRGISQRQLVERSGISRPTIKAIETGSTGRVTSMITIMRALGLKPRLSRRGRSMVPQNGNDVVYTPRPLARWVVEHFKPSGRMLEPCFGDGAFAEQMPGCDWCEINKGRDFFEYHGKADWIITNPPWSYLREILQHNMKLADNIVMIITLNSLWTRARKKGISDAGFAIREIMLIDTPPSPWPYTGMQVGVVHFSRGWTGDIKMTDHRSIAPVHYE